MLGRYKIQKSQSETRHGINQLYQLDDMEALYSNFAARFHQLLESHLQRIVVVGAAPEGERLISLCESQGIDVLAVCDGNPEKHSKPFADKYLVKPIEHALRFGQQVPIVVASHKGYKAIKELRGLGVECVIPFAVLQVLFPDRFAPHMFYRNWLENLFATRDEHSTLLASLEDDVSRATLDAILRFRLTFEDAYLLEILAPEAYFPHDVVTFSPEGIYIDGGTFNGDTIHQYIQAARGRYSKIIAFEPDPQTFNTLKANIGHLPNVTPVNNGLFSHSTNLRFSSDNSRASLISDQGNTTVPVVSIDEFLDGNPVTYIKLNIEGAELDALNGARNGILQHQPILAVAAYHSPDHLWKIPKLIKEINPRYKLFLRQHDFGVVETVVYAVPNRSE